MAARMRIVADTSVWIDFYRNPSVQHAVKLDAAMGLQDVLVPDLVLAEVLRGIASDSLAGAIEREFGHFEIVQVGGREMAVLAAQNYRFLRGKGITIRGTIDLLIGTWCIENRVPLLHNDRDFDAMEQHLGLVCVSHEVIH
jgi:predicted nucleic acid-binding protein